MEELKVLVKRRGLIKAKLTRFVTFLETDPNDVANIRLRLVDINRSLQNFDEVQTEIDLLDLDGTDESERLDFENKFYSALKRAEAKISASVGEVNLSSAESQNSNNIRFQNVHLPKLSLPRYDGRLDEWLSFKETFDSVINSNESLAPIQKFNYLKSVLKNEAADVIESLEVTSSNYEHAWELLNERFNNKKRLILSHIKAIFELPESPKETVTNLRSILGGTTKHLRALKTLGQPVEKWDTPIAYVLSSKLDSVTRKELEKEYRDELPTVKNITDFLNEKCRMLENLGANSMHQVNKPCKMKNNVSNFIAIADTACFHCNGKHAMCKCGEFSKLAVVERYNRVKELGLCLNCLRKNHRAYDCKASVCQICKKKHSTLLHYPTRGKTGEQGKEKLEETPAKIDVVNTSANKIEVENATSSGNHVMCSTFSGTTQVLLSTAIIMVTDKVGKTHKARVLLDSGSQSHFITQELVNKLQLPTSEIDFKVTGINAATTVKRKAEVVFLAINESYENNISCLVVPNIGGNIPSAPVEKRNLKLPSFVKLADETFDEVGKIDVLIGAELFWQLLLPGQINLGKSRPVVRETVLGWIVAGEVPTRRFTNNIQCGLVTNEDVNEGLTRFWELESCPDRKSLSPEELFCENDFKENTKRMQTGRFIVRYPLKYSADKLGESRQMAIKRFEKTERKLKRDPKLKVEYSKFIREYEALGHLTRVKNVNDVRSYHLPHHCVTKLDSLTTRLRGVFDASAKTTSGYSLNDIQVTGPVIQQDLFSIVMRFRQHNVVLTADITKMYRQVLIQEEQRPLQRIFWRDSEAEELQCYQLNTITYGTTSASFLAVRCMFELANENMAAKPLASSIIKQDFYMDDLLTGGESVEIVKGIKREVASILKTGCFSLNKWGSNDPKFLEEIQGSSKDVILNMGEVGETKTLGLSWHSAKDKFKYSINIEDVGGINTKRAVLSIIAKIFDPLGLLGPCIISAKIILQRIWQIKLDWDELIPDDLNESFNKFKKQLPSLNKIEIRRHVICKKPVKIELHGFADASESAYGAAIYISSTDAQGSISCNLLCAKSRVAPLKTLTVPRLELCAALLLANLSSKVERALSIEFDRRTYWSDSKVALAWIKTSPHLLKIFIANRVTEIERLTKVSDWYYVNTRSNPADLLTRGIEPNELEEYSLWWYGPPWLLNEVDTWPLVSEANLKTKYEMEEFENESKTLKAVLMTHIGPLHVFNKWSSFKKLQRIWSYCMRFCANLKKLREDRQTSSLTTDELARATTSLIKLSQSETFGEELRDLKKRKGVKGSSKLLTLNPFLDEDDVIRVGGRLKHSEYNFDKRYPAVLDAKHILSTLLIKAEHERLLHAGPQAVLASLRDHVWIIAARNLVRKVNKDCIACFRAKPVPSGHIMADLLKARITASRPFVNCGIDFAGPFLLKDRKARKYNTLKAYVSIFVCLATKAIHLELVSELTTDAFMAALHRFVSRRGICLNIYTDNGTNFVGAKAEIYKLQTAMQNISCFDKIRWHFIPPRAPHFGGIWEAGVKSFKYHLNRVVGNTKLTFEEFVTILTQVEGCLNSRPLSPLSSDPNDPSSLTPGHFLIGQPITGLVEPELQSEKVNLVKRFHMVQQIKQHFWTRWSKEYISELQVRTKWKVQQPSLLKIGALVVIKEDNLPPLKWELGRIQTLHPGSDGVVRAVTIKTRTAVLKRPTVKICVLPLQDDQVVV